ncbi:MAG TPA: hypothetical protein VFN35_35955 [Ktedonobacteraceae bacterium]|nr:hypothetical protein [Ktedonobacteraceae bacterium]
MPIWRAWRNTAASSPARSLEMDWGSQSKETSLARRITETPTASFPHFHLKEKQWLKLKGLLLKSDGFSVTGATQQAGDQKKGRVLLLQEEMGQGSAPESNA